MFMFGRTYLWVELILSSCSLLVYCWVFYFYHSICVYALTQGGLGHEDKYGHAVMRDVFTFLVDERKHCVGVGVVELEKI